MQNTNQSHSKAAVVGLLYGAFAWGLVWYPYRLLAQTGVDGLQASLLTFGFALIIGMAISVKHWHQVLPLPSGMWSLAIAAGWTNIAYILAVLDGEVVRVMLLFYLSPIWTLLLAHYWLKERTSTRGLFAILLALGGAFIMLWRNDVSLNWIQQLPLPRGNAEWWALSAGVAFAVSNVITRRSTQLSLWHKSFAVCAGVVVMSIIMMAVVSDAFSALSNLSSTTAQLGLAQFGLIIGIGLMLLTATITVQYGVSRIPATRASVIFLFELVVAAVAAYYLAGETLDANEWLGGVLIMVASVLSVTED